VTVKSKLVLECLECLNELATHNSVQLVWVPEHDGTLGNERADELANKGADTPFTGPEPVLGLPYSVVKRAIGEWMETHRVLEVLQRLQALQGPHGWASTRQCY
jgi:Ribonuclease HI